MRRKQSMKPSTLVAGFTIFVLQMLYMSLGFKFADRTQEEYRDIAILLYGGFNVVILSMFAIFIVIATKEK